MDSFFSVKRFNANEFLEIVWPVYSITTLTTLTTLFVISLFDYSVEISLTSYLGELKQLVVLRVLISIISVVINLPNIFKEHTDVLWKIYNEQKHVSKRLKRAYHSS